MLPCYAYLVGQGTAAFNPATLALTGWWKASYAGSPWIANASAGSSGSNGTMSEATNPAVTGTALNGLVPARFDQTGTGKFLTSANTLTTYISATAWSIAVLINPGATAATLSPTTPYGSPSIVAENTQAYWQLVYTTSGVTIGHYDPTAGAWKVATQACSSGSWHLVQAWFDGVNISIAVDSVAASSTPSTDQGVTATGALQMGRSFGSLYYDCSIAEVMMSNTNLGSTARANIKSYVNSRYALAL